MQINPSVRFTPNRLGLSNIVSFSPQFPVDKSSFSSSVEIESSCFSIRWGAAASLGFGLSTLIIINIVGYDHIFALALQAKLLITINIVACELLV
jgi:hypothetical protein